jgi:hypothetical protein
MSRRSMETASKRGNRISWVVAFVFIVGAAIIPAQMAHAQVLYGSITGTVTDASKAVVPNVAITVTNQDTGESHNVTTTGQGARYGSISLCKLRV